MTRRLRYLWDPTAEPDPDLANLERRLKGFAYAAPLNIKKLRAARRRQQFEQLGKTALRFLSVAIVATAVTWTISSTRQVPPQYIGGDVLVDDVSIWDGSTRIKTESWERSPIGTVEAESTSTGIITKPLVTELAASQGRRALLISSSPAGNPKILWPIRPSDIKTNELTYEASVYLSSSGPAGVVIGLVQNGEGAANYDKAAVVFANGHIRAWTADISCGTYEARRWYRVKVQTHLQEKTTDVWIDGKHAAHEVPLTGGGLMNGEHPDWSEDRLARDFESFGIGGVYDGSVLVQSNEPLRAVSKTPGEYVFGLDGSISGWRPTGVMLSAQDRVQIKADPHGEIRYAGAGNLARTNPDGYFLHAQDPAGFRRLQSSRYPVPVPSAWLGSLVAKVGDGEGFLAGSEVEFTIQEGGELFLAYNDNFTADNAGFFSITVTIKGRR